ncbi:MAG: hypothetical protein JXR37_33730 [Kiritimatiellae bacterium]|nr:hypothetical protein [Kiritimatiellia bacterium]
MTSRTGRNEAAAGAAAFTLMEFILVMGLLATVMAISAPSLARFFRQRRLDDEAGRFVALTEYGRNEAVSKGAPMRVWIDTAEQRYGLKPVPGFPTGAGDRREYRLHPEVRLVADEGNDALPDGPHDVIEFTPDGMPAAGGLAALAFEDRHERRLVVALTDDGWGYECREPADAGRDRTGGGAGRR